VYAGAGGDGDAAQLTGVTGEVLGWLGAVNPLRDRGGEFATNCVLASIAVDMALAEGGGFRAGAAELREVADIERYAGRPLEEAGGFAAVVAAVRAAGPGARGVVSFRAAGDPHDHMVNVAVDDQGRVVFLDGQAGGLAELPADPAAVRFVLTAGPLPGPAAGGGGHRAGGVRSPGVRFPGAR
jgi:hypothetical protein